MPSHFWELQQVQNALPLKTQAGGYIYKLARAWTPTLRVSLLRLGWHIPWPPCPSGCLGIQGTAQGGQQPGSSSAWGQSGAGRSAAYPQGRGTGLGLPLFTTAAVIFSSPNRLAVWLSVPFFSPADWQWAQTHKNALMDSSHHWLFPLLPWFYIHLEKKKKKRFWVSPVAGISSRHTKYN